MRLAQQGTKLKTIAIRDETLHQHLLDIKKEKNLSTIEAVITMLLATFETGALSPENKDNEATPKNTSP
jgi:hypothetical protein